MATEFTSNETIGSLSDMVGEPVYTEQGVGSRAWVVAFIPHFSAALSFLGSLYILVDIFRDKKKLRNSIYFRLILGLSLSDLVASGAFFFSSWPIPEGTIAEGAFPVYGSKGNTQTCTAQGFFVQLGVATFLYSAFLSIYYLLMTRFGWRERDFSQPEKWFHGCAILLSFGTAIAGLALELFNSAGLWCWISEYPQHCVSSYEASDEEPVTCERGNNAYIYRIAFYFFWLWSAAIIVIVCMSLVFWTVYKQSRVMSRWDAGRAHGENTKTRTISTQEALVRNVAVQSSLYIVGFLITAIAPTLVYVTTAVWNCQYTNYALTVTNTTLFPLQGFWNFFIYMRPRFLNTRQAHPHWSTFQVIKFTLNRTLGCGVNMDDDDYKVGLNEKSNSATSRTSDYRNDSLKHVSVTQGSSRVSMNAPVSKEEPPVGSQETGVIGLNSVDSPSLPAIQEPQEESSPEPVTGEPEVSPRIKEAEAERISEAMEMGSREVSTIDMTGAIRQQSSRTEDYSDSYGDEN